MVKNCIINPIKGMNYIVFPGIVVHTNFPWVPYKIIAKKDKFFLNWHFITTTFQQICYIFPRAFQANFKHFEKKAEIHYILFPFRDWKLLSILTRRKEGIFFSIIWRKYNKNTNPSGTIYAEIWVKCLCLSFPFFNSMKIDKWAMTS